MYISNIQLNKHFSSESKTCCAHLGVPRPIPKHCISNKDTRIHLRYVFNSVIVLHVILLVTQTCWTKFYNTDSVHCFLCLTLDSSIVITRLSIPPFLVKFCQEKEGSHFHYICPFLNLIMLYSPIEVISYRCAAKSIFFCS